MRSRSSIPAILGLALAPWWPELACASEAGAADRAAAERYRKDIVPLLETYCYDCHGDGAKKGELSLDSFSTLEAMRHNRGTWKRIRDHIGYGLMPPPDEDQPGAAEKRQLLSWIDDAVFPVDPANPDPGRIALRRLNREEYRNTIRDLLGVDLAVESILPVDDSGYGFDNIGDVLTLSPVHIERYLSAARKALDKAVHPDPMPHPARAIAGSDLEGPGVRSEEGHYLITAGEALAVPEIAPGRYRLRITAGGTLGGQVAPKMELRLDGILLKTWDVSEPQGTPGTYVQEIRIDQPGKHRIGLAFPNDFYDLNQPDPWQRDRNLMVNRIEIEGPLDGPPRPKPETHRRIYGEHRSGVSDRDYALEVLTRFGRRAFRRPPRPGEIERYLKLLEVAKGQGQDVEHGIRLALEAMLVSPSFLFREEPAQEGTDKPGIVALNEHALASRLSYFLWSSLPDRRLSGLADEGRLRENLDAEIARMIASEKSRRFISNFGGQWLQLRNLASANPDQKRFPSFTGSLADDMRRETELLLTDILQRDLPATTLLDADYTFLNERLARHYGIEGVTGTDFRRVSLPDGPRRGIFGHGSVLTVTSYPTRTSPVLRGKYVLENLLDITPPPPPPNIPQLEPPGGHGRNTSLREQMERHREDPACSSCHALMDPIGFGLEQFDAIGAFRETEHGKPVDSSGKLVDGGTFTGAAELRGLLVRDHRAEFHRALATKLLTYALGRGVEWYDRPAVDAIVARADSDNGRLQSFIRAVVTSVPFQYRRTSGASSGS